MEHELSLFMVEISKRLVKIAKTAMILNGDGHTGMTQGDSLGSLEKLNENVRALAGRGKPTLLLTNPPFAGVGEGKISDPKVLDNFMQEFGGQKETVLMHQLKILCLMVFHLKCFSLNVVFNG